MFVPPKEGLKIVLIRLTYTLSGWLSHASSNLGRAQRGQDYKCSGKKLLSKKTLTNEAVTTSIIIERYS